MTERYSQKKVREFYEECRSRKRKIFAEIGCESLEGIQKIVHAGERFMFVETLEQEIDDGEILEASTRNVESFLSPPEKPSYKKFLDIAFTHVNVPFILVAYDDKTLDYALSKSTIEVSDLSIKLLTLDSGTPFYLVTEKDIKEAGPKTIMRKNVKVR